MTLAEYGALNLRAITVIAALALATGVTLPAVAQDEDADEIRSRYRARAAATLHEQMRRVASWLQSYCALNHRFPQQQDELTVAKSQLIELAPYNPYNSFGGPEFVSAGLTDSGPVNIPNAGQPGAQLTPEQSQRIQLQMDYSLSRQEIQNWYSDPPDSLSADPGTITALSNDRGLFVVWGAGADGHPIRNQMGKPIFVEGSWFGSERQDTSSDTSTDTSSSD